MKEWIGFRKQTDRTRQGMEGKDKRTSGTDPRSTRSSMRRIQVDDAHTKSVS